MKAQPDPSVFGSSALPRFLRCACAASAVGVAAMCVALPVAGATFLIDVRTPAEFASGHLPGAINIDHESIGQRIAAAGVTKNDEVILYCRSGRRSGIALQTLRGMGFSKVEDYGTIEAAQQRLARERR
jgi:phage shock protein E